MVQGKLTLEWRCPRCGQRNREDINPLSGETVIRDSLIVWTGQCEQCLEPFEVKV